MFPPTPLGFYDVYGNVWDWVEDHINGFPGFKVTYLYNDYTCPSADTNHNIGLVSHHGTVWIELHLFCINGILGWILGYQWDELIKICSDLVSKAFLSTHGISIGKIFLPCSS